MNDVQMNRFADTQSSFLRAKGSITKQRAGFIEWLIDVEPTHYVTINFHGQYSMEKAQKLMNKWYDFVHRRLYGNCPESIDEARRIKLIGYPEYTQSGHIHYHCFARLPADRVDWFCRIGESKFKKIVKTGTLHVRPFGQTEQDRERAASYTTKSSSSVEWYLPEHHQTEQMQPVLH